MLQYQHHPAVVTRSGGNTHPSPADMISKHTRQHGSKGRCNSPGGPDESLVLPALPCADQVPDEDDDQRRDAPGAHPLHHPGGDQHRDVLRGTTQAAPRHED